MLVWITPEEYDDFLKFLANNGFSYMSGEIPGTGSSILERAHNPELSVVYSIDVQKRKVGYFPLEIYAKDSPTRDDEKFNRYLSQTYDCVKVKDIIKRELSNV